MTTALLLALLAQDPDPSQIDLSIRKGIAYLKANNAAHLMTADHVGRKMSKRELVLYTYAVWGMAETEPEFKTLFDDLMKDVVGSATYCVALQAMALEEIDRVKYQRRIWQCAQTLVDNQAADGSWGYGGPSIYAEDPPDIKPKPPAVAAGARVQPGLRQKPAVQARLKVDKHRDGEKGDLSNSYYAAMGLRACYDAGILPAPKIVDAAMGWLRRSQKNERVAAEPFLENPPLPKPRAVAPQGWCYNDHADHKAYGSMTAAGTVSLAAWVYLKDNDDGKKKSWRKDQDLLEGLQWLSKNFSVGYNPGPYEHSKMEENSVHQHYYYLHALSGVGLMYGTEVFGTHSWYTEGAKVLLASQGQDGRWGQGAGDTCLALLFLKRATRWLAPPEASK